MLKTLLNTLHKHFATLHIYKIVQGDYFLYLCRIKSKQSNILKNMKKSNFTYLGLLIAYSSLTLVSQLFKSLFPSPLTDASVIFRELIMLGMVGLLFWIILKKEHLPLSSIGLGARKWKETTLWSILTFAFSLVGIFGALAMVKGLGMTYGESQTMSKLSTGTLALSLPAGRCCGRSLFQRLYL
jgi:hypothetical protein